MFWIKSSCVSDKITLSSTVLVLIFMHIYEGDCKSISFERKVLGAVKTAELRKGFVKAFEGTGNSNFQNNRVVNTSALADTFRLNLKQFLLSYVDGLLEIKSNSESLYQNYEYNSNLEPFKYPNDKDCNPDSINIRFSRTLSINLNYSFVQVPTEIFRNDVKILNEVKWSQDLDVLFRDNFKNNPTLQWQYIGKESGAMRSFPGSK